jgi:phytoene synthase
VVAAAGERDANAANARRAREHYENFPVASWVLPAPMRPHVAAVYAFARIADDYADEGADSPEVRLANLDEWRRRLKATAAGWPVPAGPHPEVFVALGETIRTHDLPVSLFEDLLSAFAQDVTTTRYETWADVLDYCRRSANPVGRLVLRIAGYRDERLDRLSDEVCTALQLTNFWQDLAVDWQRGRLYVPADVLARHWASVTTFDPLALTPAWRAAIADCCARTQAMFDRGRGICDAVPGRLRYELRLTWLGGTRILERVVAAGDDVAHRRPALGPRDVPAILWRAVTWRAAAEGGR